MSVYVFDNAWEQERERLVGLESVNNPGTISHLQTIGIAEGWRCLEVGGGAGSIAEWLCARVGPKGSVLATDIDTRFLDALSQPNLEVRKHDIASDELPAEAFDLVHARAVLEHLPERDKALARMVEALRPGGWLLVEDGDFSRPLSLPETAFRYPAAQARRGMRVLKKMTAVLGQSGFDPEYAIRLPGELVAQGLVDVGGETRSVLVWGGSRGSLVQTRGLDELRAKLIEAGA